MNKILDKNIKQFYLIFPIFLILIYSLKRRWTVSILLLIFLISFVITEWGWRNFQRWIGAGFDNHLITPNMRIHRLLTRLSIDNLLHPFQNFIVGQKSFAPKMAVRLNIPLVFYGESDAEYGTGPKERFDTPKRDLKFSSSNKGFK